MKTIQRARKASILKDLQKKMVFLTGPRQVGKTWLAKEIANEYENPLYLNYDRKEDRDIIDNEAWLDKTDLLIFDELHKMRDWKTVLKGIFDTRLEHQHILVTGSARLETFRQMGESLAGRFYLHRLLPLCPAEVPAEYQNDQLENFLSRGGFPEPFLAEDNTEADRWRNLYADGLIREDILSLEKILNLKAVQLILEMLRSRVGSPVSWQSIAEDVGIAPNSVKHYIEILESLYIIFLVRPYSNKIARSILKAPKVYFYDTGMVKGDKGCLLENLTAVSLLKHTWAKVDLKGTQSGLYYLRTKEGRETDFCITENQSVVSQLEIKLSDTTPGKGIQYFKEKYDLPSKQLVLNLKREQIKKGIEILKVNDYLKSLFI